jgi:two-component system response regulator
MINDAMEILLVDDDALDVELTLRILRQENIGNRVHVARDGEEALDFLFCRGQYAGRSLEHPLKLVLLDLKLPKVDGLQILREMKANPETRIVPVVMLTSSLEQRDVIESYELGVNSYIQKPVDIAQFRQTIKALGLYWLVVNQPPISQDRVPRG